MAVTIICPVCQKQFSVVPAEATRRRFCSIACKAVGMNQQGPRNPSWNGGRRIDRNGYVLIYCPNHPAAVNSYVREHRVVMEQTLGRLLEPHEVVHHINGIKDDNRPENLHLFGSNSAHMQHHPHSEKPTNNATQRRCHRCHEIKPLTDQFFSKSKQGKYGFGYLCNQCRYEKYLERTPNRKRRQRHSRK